MESVLRKLAKLDELTLQGIAFPEACEAIQMDVETATALLNQYAVPPNGPESISASPLLKAVCPIFRTDKQHCFMTHIGSGVLLRLGDETFLISAAHVTDHNKSHILHIPGNNGITPINGYFADSLPFLSKTRADDKGDTSYYRLAPELAESLDFSLKPLGIADLELDDSLADGDLFTFVGYPWRKTKDGHGTQQTDRTTYTGHVFDDKTYNTLGYSRNLHVAIRVRLRKTYSSRHESFQTAPHPHGISGGAVFSWPRGFANRMNGPTLKLAAIAHTYHANLHCLAATRVIGLLLAILRNNPGLETSLPLSVQEKIRFYVSN
jgi:hypothetical protein